MDFKPLVRRDLKFVVSDVQQDVVIALSAPYKPAQDDTMAEQGYAACLVLTCDDPTLSYEVFGKDEFEALQMAMIRISDFLIKLAADPSGELRELDGSLVDPEGSSYLRGYLELLAKK